MPFIRRVLIESFDTPLEADLVEGLRDDGTLEVSLVAEADGRVVGHIAFSPVSVGGNDLRGVGLAPLAVLPTHRGRGIGGRLIEAGLEVCIARGVGFVVVLGEPGIYGRFGFTRASDAGLTNVYGVDDPFMVREVRPNGLRGVTGLVRFDRRFDVFDDLANE